LLQTIHLIRVAQSKSLVVYETFLCDNYIPITWVLKSP